MFNDWTDNDDKRLVDAVNTLLETTNQLERYLSTKQLVLGFSWDKISFTMKTHSSKECRERFLLHISPETHETNWTLNGVEFLSLLRQRYSSNVEQILEHFPCRLEQDITFPSNEPSLKRKSEQSFEEDFFKSVIRPLEKKFCSAFIDTVPEYDEFEFEALLNGYTDVQDDFQTEVCNLISCF